MENRSKANSNPYTSFCKDCAMMESGENNVVLSAERLPCHLGDLDLCTCIRCLGISKITCELKSYILS